MTPVRGKFSIDDHLGRRAKALGHLRSLDEFDEFKAYMARHGLYEAALQLYKLEGARVDEIMARYAGFLESQSRFKEAGLAFEFVQSYQEAMGCYRAAGFWQEALFCASQASIPKSQIEELATALTDSLCESRDYANAAKLYIEYRHDVELAVRALCKGYLFAEALRLITSYGRSELLESVFDPELGTAMATSIELLSECKGQLNAQVPRLKELRVTKERDPLAFFDGVSGPDLPDNISIAATETSASTAGSLFTRYTHNSATGTLNSQTSRRSSKNRRREERKRARGKKGSIYEEDYLVNSLRRLIERVNRVRDDVTRLVEALFRRRMAERASAVQKTMGEVLDLCAACVRTVLLPVERECERVLHEDEAGAEAGADADADGILHAARSSGWGSGSGSTPDPPTISVVPFEKLSLLGS
ncbi:MAG: hypothetical protein M1826_006485 [Phylliscum demangeonii]|nr:MAG: hypothetical protein M1826_006485 [Phylliscum demangeonii]